MNLLPNALLADLSGLVRKYNRPGPRYTSYPTAPNFHEGFGAADYLTELDGADTGTAPGELSLYVHLPFCRSQCYYCGCHMLVTHRPEKIEQYVRYVEREIDLIARHVSSGRRVVQVHWGGGTPTFLAPEQIRRLMMHIRDRFVLAAGAEVSIEADPRGLTEEHLAAARDAGFNRISFGVQDFDPFVQEAINRVQSPELVAQATDRARRLGFEGVSYDLIYGLPHQTTERFRETLNHVLTLSPDRISLFSYAHVPWMKKHQRLIDEGALPAPERKLDTFLMAMERLTDGGAYAQIGMDHFVKPGDSLSLACEAGTMQRNFQGYSTHAGAELIGFGISSISQFRKAYAQNVLDLPSYYAAIDAGSPATARGYRLTFDDRLRREVIMQLMCRFRLDAVEIETRFGIDFSDYFADALSGLGGMQQDGLVAVTPTGLSVTPMGRLFIRNVAMAFDGHLKGAESAARPRHAQTL